MIYAEFFVRSNGEMLGFSVKGHNGLAGKDIICAAVSSAAYMTANTITEVIKADAEVTVEDGYMTLKIPLNEANGCLSILSGFKFHMLQLEEQYPENINVNYTEV